METRIIDGRKIASDERNEVRQMIQKNKLSPDMLIIQVGDDPASTQYVGIKKKRAEEVGISMYIEKLAEVNEKVLGTQIRKLIQEYKHVDGIMIQLPLPLGVDTTAVLSLIPPNQDVDGLLLDKAKHGTAVANAVQMIINLEKLQKKKILILGNSPYVGGSILRKLADQRGYPHVAVADINTRNILKQLSLADVVVSCIGKPQVYKATQMKPGSVLIDVGTSPDSTGQMVGDFDVSEANGHLAAYTPVPGGVGPITVAMLLRNLVYLVFDQET